eukprot:2686064-Ditylum_brightwellii.AAC.1
MSYPSPVCNTANHFVQLYGMTDNLTYTLDGHGFCGQVNEITLYLMRRAYENSDILGNSPKEIFMKDDR